MAVEVALAMLQRDGLWLMQLRDEIPTSSLPALKLVMVHHIHQCTAHDFRAELSVPLEQLQLLEGQDMALVSAEEC